MTVNSGASSVSDGVSLNGMTKAVVFDVEGTAKDIFDNSSQLSEATNVTATGGPAITVAQTQIFKNISYNETGSSYSVSDTAAQVISGGNNLLSNGNIVVNVNDGPVNASDGATLSAFSTANIQFSVQDSALEIVSEVSGSSTDLDNASSVTVQRDTVTPTNTENSWLGSIPLTVKNESTPLLSEAAWLAIAFASED